MIRTILFLISMLITLILSGQDKTLNYDEETIGNTYYDLQTWRTMQNRFFHFDDHTKGAVWNMGFDYPDFSDLGIGYNFFDGSGWGSYPVQSITSVWAVNPSYTAYLENGEMCVSQGENGLIISIREVKGYGSWQENIITGDGYKHPVVVTSGVGHSVIQLLYLDADEAFNPTNAQPARGFIRYARSTNGGQTWNPSGILLDGLGPEEYLGFTIGSYCWAEPKQEVIAFVAGDYLTDLILMKSLDGGENWQKTVIWEHPYPMFEIFTFDSDTFYCNDGGISIALDDQNKAHVTFTLSRVYSSTVQDSIWYDPQTDGVVYWNEDRPSFSNDLNALCPYVNCTYTELEEDYSLVGWIQDINCNDTIDLLNDIRTYPTPGMCTMPQIVINALSHIILSFSAVTEWYDNGVANYRHNWIRVSPNGEWWGNFTDLNAQLAFLTSECIYPSLAAYSIDMLYFIFQEDNEPGLNGPLTSIYTNNNIRFMSIDLNGWPPPYWVDANFEPDTSVVHEGDTVSFINLSSGNVPDMIHYFWAFEGGIPPVSFDTNPKIVYLNEGLYDVQLTANIYTCFDTKKIEDCITVLPATKIQKNYTNDLLIIFPNPGIGLFTINLKSATIENPSIKVYNILGEKIYEKTIKNGEDQFYLDLTSQENGLYFVQINSGNKLNTRKIAIRR